MAKITAIKNLGPVCEELFSGIESNSAEEIQKLIAKTQISKKSKFDVSFK